jgi:hypothetical protein
MNQERDKAESEREQGNNRKRCGRYQHSPRLSLASTELV